MADIFLSYAREDDARAVVVTRGLGKLGWSVFWDSRIIAGTSWDEVIERELTSCRCVVVLWSAASINSNWVKTEARFGLRRNVLVPASLDRSEPPLEFRFLESAQLHAWSGNIDDPEFSVLIEGIEQHLKPRGRELNGESSATATAEPEGKTGLVDPAPSSHVVVHEPPRSEAPTLSSTKPETRRPPRRPAPQPFPDWAPAAGFALVVLTILFMMWLVFVARDVRCGQRPLFVFIMALTAAGAAGFWGGSATARGKLPFFKDSPLAIAASGAVGTLVIVLVLGFKLYASGNCTEARAEPSAASHPLGSLVQPAAQAPQPSLSPAPAQPGVDGAPSTELRIKTQKELFSIPSEEREKAENNQIPLDETGDGCQFIFFDERPLDLRTRKDNPTEHESVSLASSVRSLNRSITVNSRRQRR